MGARLLAHRAGRCNSRRRRRAPRMMQARIGRRKLLMGGGAMAAALTVPLGRVWAQAAADLPAIPLPPPITTGERLERLARARALMRQHGIGSVIVESG